MLKKTAKPTGNIRLEAQAEKNGVAFRATKFSGPAKVPYGTLATVKENTIHTVPWYGATNIQTKIQKWATPVFVVSSILAIIFLISYFVIGALTETRHNILFFLGYMMLSVMWLHKAVGIFLARIFGNREIKSFSKFLAAKNAVENAFYHSDSVPSLEEAQTYSIFTHSSKYISRNAAVSATLWFAVALVFLVPFPWHTLPLIAVVTAFLIFRKKLSFSFWQFLIVSKPEEIHFKAALVALQESLSLIDSIYVSTTVGIEEVEDIERLEFSRKDQ